MPGALQLPCEICSSKSLRWAQISGFDHYRCVECRHIFVCPKPSQKELDGFYARRDYYEHAEQHLVDLEREAEERAERLLRLANRLQLEARLLDIGCGTGTFLRAARLCGWSGAGVDRSEELATQARRNSQCAVTVGVAEQVTISGTPFPVVTAWEVLEHNIDPKAFLKALARHTQEGGIVAISTPLADGWIARILGSRFPMLSPPDHLSIFSKQSLLILAEQSGLEVTRWRAFSNIRSPQLASGFARFVLKKRVEDLKWPASVAVHFLAAAFAWVPKVIDFLGQGSEMEVFLRKRAAKA